MNAFKYTVPEPEHNNPKKFIYITSLGAILLTALHLSSCAIAYGDTVDSIFHKAFVFFYGINLLSAALYPVLVLAYVVGGVLSLKKKNGMAIHFLYGTLIILVSFIFIYIGFYCGCIIIV